MPPGGYPRPSPWVCIKKDLVSRRRGSVVAVVGYIGADAPAVMPLRAGDCLVCDASPTAIKSRLTSAKALLEYDRKGVAVYSLEDLHAKVIAAKTFAWVGSTNASQNSREHLIEASVRVVGTQAKSVFEWALQQTVEDRALSTDDLRDLKRIPLDPARRQPRRQIPTRPNEVPVGLRRVVFYEVGPATEREEKIAEKSRSSAKSAARASGIPSRLGYLVWTGPAQARAGDWIIQISNGHVLRPALVVRVARDGSKRVLWLSTVKTPTKPAVAILRQSLPDLMDGFNEFVLTGPTRVGKILRLFGVD